MVQIQLQKFTQMAANGVSKILQISKFPWVCHNAPPKDTVTNLHKLQPLMKKIIWEVDCQSKREGTNGGHVGCFRRQSQSFCDHIPESIVSFCCEKATKTAEFRFSHRIWKRTSDNLCTLPTIKLSKIGFKQVKMLFHFMYLN